MNKAIMQRSERIYNFLLKFYPKRYRKEFGEEMKYVFSESLKDAYRSEGEHGIFTLWTRTILDVGKSIFTQHLENQKGGDSMKTKSTTFINKNKDIIGSLTAAALVLLLPWFAMQFSNEVNWDETDFIVIGALLFGTALMFVLVLRKAKSLKQKIILSIALAFALVLVWAELAVGIFTNIGS